MLRLLPNPGMQKRRERRKALWAVLARRDLAALEEMGRWWSQNPDCLNDPLLCLVLKKRHAWALERLLNVGVPVCWRTVRAAADKLAHPEDQEILEKVWPLLLPALQHDPALRSQLMDSLAGQDLPRERLDVLRLNAVFEVQGWETPLKLRVGTAPYPELTALQWAVRNRNPGLAQVLVESGASAVLCASSSSWPEWTLQNELNVASPDHPVWGSLKAWLNPWIRERALETALPVVSAVRSRGPRF